MPRDTNEIGLSEKTVRRKRARRVVTPILRLPSSANIEPVETPVRKRRAKSNTTPKTSLPGVSPIGQDASPVREQGTTTVSPPSIQMSPAPTIGHNSNRVAEQMAIVAAVNELVSLQRRRRFAITEKNRSERAIESLIASSMGFRIDASEKDRKKTFAQAKAFRLSVERGGESQVANDTHGRFALSAIVPLILKSAETRQPWVELRAEAEKLMEKTAKALPVYDFAKDVRGFGALGLAVLAAEAGIPMGEYRSVSALWKRMGLAVFDGERQQRMRDKDQAAIHGYSPKRRAEVWAFCSDSMFRNQWRGDKDEDGGNPVKSGKPVAIPAHPIGPYGEVYAKRRARTEPRVLATAHLTLGDPDKWTAMRCHNDARRIMSKALLRDLFRVWRGMPPRGSEIRSDAEGEASPLMTTTSDVPPPQFY